MAKGFLLVLEGGEACGKSTQVKLLEKYFQEKGIDFLLLREPGTTELGENVRNILLNKNIDLNFKTETLLFNAARSELCEKVIIPALNQGKLVLLDRFYYSTLVYQGYSLGQDAKSLLPIIKFATDGVKPDLAIFLTQPAEISYKRKIEEGKQDRIESRSFEYYKKVEQAYESLAKQNREVKTVNANQPIQKVHKDIIQIFEKNYKK